jgi:hypothetical protein
MLCHEHRRIVEPAVGSRGVMPTGLRVRLSEDSTGTVAEWGHRRIAKAIPPHGKAGANCAWQAELGIGPRDHLPRSRGGHDGNLTNCGAGCLSKPSPVLYREW